ncbi:uncharacterized protein LOC122533198 [Frieseomelitta varia]|uniref:uncharacterized protein LOC122533198 n=1 Tax=Frieseomelitta varia TaxID=561572 RepID=UPI001CB69984|nr:uncharacterized protein LOC122533198 [Frieseomelitta varia]
MLCCNKKEELCVDNSNYANHDNIHMKRGCIFDCHFGLCRNNEACFIPMGCNTLQSVNNVSISTCLEPCQCAEEMEWNCFTPPKPSCKWLNNFCELRRQWSNHARQQNCRCCNCKQRQRICKF